MDNVNKQITDSINTDFGIKDNVSTGITASNLLTPSQLNFAGAYGNQSNINDLLNLLANKESSVSLSIGDIVLQGVQDVNGLAKAINSKLHNALAQELSKVF